LTEPSATVDLGTLVSLCKRRGFIFQSSEIYGGLASTWDYGPLGVELKNNVKNAWWKAMVWGRDDMVGLDAAILMHPDVWKASGHTERFNDPMIECTNCQLRIKPKNIKILRVMSTEDQDLGFVTTTGESVYEVTKDLRERGIALAKSRGKQFKEFLELSAASDVPLDSIPCPECGVGPGTFTEPKMFNQMLQTQLGPVQDDTSLTYLRPETAQGIFVNFGNVLTATRRKLPFGIAQIGKSFRNEITTGSFTFRTREFEIMELEYFVRPGEDEEWHERWVADCMAWYTGLGMSPERLHLRAHEPKELAHYAKATTDIEYQFPWGWGEIQGIANRTDYDLKAHSEASGESLTFFDDDAKEHITPYVIEPSAGVDRAVLAFLMDAYTEEETISAKGKAETRVLLKLHPELAPIKVAILPLSRNEKLAPLAREIHRTVQSSGVMGGLVQYDDAQSIGRRYRRQDEVGTPLCVTVDFDSLDDDAVTIRERDTMAQDRVKIEDLVDELRKRLNG
jgi:glycyl-tRNA synthetase